MEIESAVRSGGSTQRGLSPYCSVRHCCHPPTPGQPAAPPQPSTACAPTRLTWRCPRTPRARSCWCPEWTSWRWGWWQTGRRSPGWLWARKAMGGRHAAAWVGRSMRMAWHDRRPPGQRRVCAGQDRWQDTVGVQRSLTANKLSQHVGSCLEGAQRAHLQCQRGPRGAARGLSWGATNRAAQASPDIATGRLVCLEPCQASGHAPVATTHQRQAQGHRCTDKEDGSPSWGRVCFARAARPSVSTALVLLHGVNIK